MLLVEDHAPTRHALARFLETLGFEVAEAGTVEESLALAEKGKFDLLVADIGLPDGDGFALMHRLRSRHGLKGIALTAFGLDEDIELSRQAGFDVHITKPVELGALDRALAKLKL